MFEELTEPIDDGGDNRTIENGTIWNYIFFYYICCIYDNMPCDSYK